MGNDSRGSKVILFPIQKPLAVPHIGGNHGYTGGKAFQYGKGLSLTDAGQYGGIHPAKIIRYLDSSCKYNVLKVHGLHHTEALCRVILVLVKGAHNPQLQLRLSLLGIGKGLNQRLHVLDGCHTEYRSDMNISGIFRTDAGQTLQSLVVDPVGGHHGFSRRASKLDLEFSGIRV